MELMILRKSLSAAAAAALLAGATAAVAAPADAPRTASPVAKKDELAGVGTFAAIAAVVAAITVIAILASGDDDPASP